jgi:SAM-dependent methyltransferase
MLAINLGGEGEVPDVINQQGPWALGPNWFCARDGRTFAELVAAGDPYLICPNIPLPFPDNTFDIVYTNGVPLNQLSLHGPGVQEPEIKRILKPGGQWVKDGTLEWTKP